MGLTQHLWSQDVLGEPGSADFQEEAFESLGLNAASMSSSSVPAFLSGAGFCYIYQWVLAETGSLKDSPGQGWRI